MAISGVTKCPLCDGILKYYDSIKRMVREKDGEKIWTKVKRYRCSKCHSIRREYPDFIIPHKQYDANIVTGFKEGIITSDTIGFEDYPCDMTIKRWTQE